MVSKTGFGVDRPELTGKVKARGCVASVWLSGPRHGSHEVAVRQQVFVQVEGWLGQLNQSHLEPGLSGTLKRGYHVRVSGHHQDAVHGFPFGELGDIQADPHVHTLLFKHRNEVSVSKRQVADRNGFWLPSSKADCASPDGKPFEFRQVLEPLVVRLKAREGSRYGKGLRPPGIVEHRSKRPGTGTPALRSKSLKTIR